MKKLEITPLNYSGHNTCSITVGTAMVQIKLFSLGLNAAVRDSCSEVLCFPKYWSNCLIGLPLATVIHACPWNTVLVLCKVYCMFNPTVHSFYILEWRIHSDTNRIFFLKVLWVSPYTAGIFKISIVSNIYTVYFTAEN